MSAVMPRARAFHSGFHSEVSRVGKSLHVSLHGYLDEEAKLPKLDLRPDDVIEVDFSDLLGMDTDGVHAWETFVRNNAGRAFVFENCPEFLIKSANFFPDFLPADVRVNSFDVKFRCGDCNSSGMVQFVRDRHFAVWAGGYGRLHTDNEVHVCDCGSRLRPKMVEPEAKYLEFLKRTKG